MTRLVCGGNPFGGFSHVSSELDREMVECYTMPHLQGVLDECWKHGLNTVQSRGASGDGQAAQSQARE